MPDALSILVNDVINKVSLTSVSSLVTDAASIFTNISIKNIDSTLTFNIMTHAASILVNNAIDKVSSTSVSSLVTDTAFILTNDTTENIDSTLAF